MTRLFLVAGEPSGDRLGGALIDGLPRSSASSRSSQGVGGPAMAAARASSAASRWRSSR